LRAVVQRVSEARVEVGDEIVGEMGAGLLALVGVGADDGPDDVAALAAKLCQLRVFEDDEGRLNRSLIETGGTLGVVSQFTVMGDVRKGRRPSFAAAAAPEEAAPLVEALIDAARALGVPVISGRFRATMEVSLVNQGPVTLLIDTKRAF
jgi:D-tyrosyl-tRNA(Tyr) deacylase